MSATSCWMTCVVVASGLVLSIDASAIAQSMPPEGVDLPSDTPNDIERLLLPSQPLPEVEDTPPPPPEDEPTLTSPADADSSGTPELPNLEFYVNDITVLGNTVLHDEIEADVSAYEGRSLTLDDLFELRSKITQLYIANGYITSGAFVPNNQDLSNGTVVIQVVEGTLEAIEVEGLNRLRRSYIQDRIALRTDAPINQFRIEEALQLLQLDPLIQRVDAELTAGSAPGQNVLLVRVEETEPFTAAIGADNYQSTSIGSEQASIQASYANLLGVGDRISAGYGFTDGLNSYDISYAIPVNAREGTLSLSFSRDESRIVEDEFEEIDIRSNSETYSVAFRQPLVRRPTSEFAVGIGLDLRRSQSYILDDVPFSFSEGPEAGESNVTALRLSQDWVERDATRVLAARSQFSIGLDALDATVNDSGTDARFVSWLGQFQWVQQITPRVIVLSRLNAQLTPDSLLPLERFGFGGVDTVRGYPQNQLVTDNGVLGSVEVRLPLTADPNQLQLIPFFDAAHGWNNKIADPADDFIAGVGLGVRWQITPQLNVRLDYGIPLVDVDNDGNSLQDNGIYLSVGFRPF